MARADLRRRIIPDVYLFPFMLIGMVVVCYFPWVSTPGESAAAAAFGYALSFTVGQIFKKSAEHRSKSAKKSDYRLPITDYHPIGLGDVKLLAAGGIWLGTSGLAAAIVISCIVGGIWGLRKKQKYIPYAPFFFIGAIIALIGLWILI
jgi:prepilin signal peptidase PulO-like enzyme (type II secretory pathway)